MAESMAAAMKKAGITYFLETVVQFETVQDYKAHETIVALKNYNAGVVAGDGGGSRMKVKKDGTVANGVARFGRREATATHYCKAGRQTEETLAPTNSTERRRQALKRRCAKERRSPKRA